MRAPIGISLPEISCWCDVALRSLPAGSQSDTHPVRLDELRAGDILAQNLYTTGGKLLVSAGTTVSAVLLTTLLNFQALKAIDNSVLVRGV